MRENSSSRETLHTYEKDVLQKSIDAMLSRTADSSRDPSDGLVKTDLVRLGRLIMMSISAAVIGLDDLDIDGRRERLGDCADALIEGILVEWAEPERHEEIMAEARKWKQIYDEEFVTPGLARRQTDATKSSQNGEGRLDLLTVLLRDQQNVWTHERILRESILFLVASSLTTSTAMTHTVTHLDTWLRDHPEDQAKVSDAGFLRAAAMESLRLHPGPHILLRRASDDGTVVAGDIKIDAGQVVGADVREGNVDPDAYGPDANEFNPRRELEKGIPAEGLTFGGGRHVCIGRPLALGTYGGMKASDVDGILVRMLRSFYAAGVRPDPDRPVKKAESAHDRYDHLPVVLADL